jgi:hypothetical protein
MSQRPTLDASTFEGLLAAAWVLQRQHEQEALNHRPVTNEMLAEPPKTHVEPDCVSELDTTNARLMAALSELSKAANRLHVSMQVRCAKCANESDSRCRFCGTCGAQLLEPQPTPQTEPPAQSKPAPEQVPPVGGFSLFPGLADESDSSLAYLLEDGGSTSHWGHVLVLVVLLGCAAATVWHWRRDLRDRAARFSQRPAAPAVPSARPATVTSTPGSNENEPASGTARAVSRANPPAALSGVEGPQITSLHNSESQTPPDAQSAIYQNKWTPTSHKIQTLTDGVWEKTATKPSACIPFDSVATAAPHDTRSVSSARPAAAGTSMPERNRDGRASDTVRADAVAPAGVSRANPPAAPSAVDAPQGASLHNSESQTTHEVQSTMARNKRTPTDHNIESLTAGGRENAATKLSAGTPFDSVAMATRHYVPRPPPGFGDSMAMDGHTIARRRSQGGPSASRSRSERAQVAMSRTVPRPPWSSTNRRTSAPWVPRPPAGRIPRAIPGYALPTWPAR